MDENVLLKTEIELDFKKYDVNTRRIKNMNRDELICKVLDVARALTLLTAITVGNIGIDISRVERSVEDDLKCDPAGSGGAI